MKVKKSPGHFKWMMCLMFLILVHTSVWAQDLDRKGYVGSDVCLQCHEAEYKSFSKYARKSKSYRSVSKMKKGLTLDEITECYACHTTGYGEPGGFISPEKTPELKNAGCEVCHGAGGLHAETQDPDHIIGKVTIEICEKCHIEERVRSFRYRPMLHGGAH